ncbi:MAG: ATP-binding cassette domain-containing protein, partial [Gordonia sp. (in: high G+C Gram-positive bacteria)]
MTTTGPAALAADAVTRTFGRTTVVDAVTLAVRPGEVVGLIGANGAGKTTLIRMLLGLLTPTSGSVAIFGSAPTRAGRARLGYVPQNLGLYRDLTIAENLAFSSRVHGQRQQRRQQRHSASWWSAPLSTALRPLRVVAGSRARWPASRRGADHQDTAARLPADLTRYARTRVAELPLGTQRQAAFAVAFAHRPE